MNSKILFLPLICFYMSSALAQTKVSKDPSSLGVLFFNNFFKKNIDNKNINSQGVAINFTKGITNNYNISTTINGSFIEYPISKEQHDNSFLLEWDILCRRKFNLSNVVIPYVGTGITSSVYKDNFGMLVPVNAGLQVKLTDQLFMLADAQYKWKLTSNTANHLQLSIGISSPVFQKRKQAVKSSMNYARIEAASTSLKDSDGDGIVDTADACPHVAGVARYNGCPIPDADKDGVNDEEDKCPDIAGAKSNGGCPILDRDNDGIVDSLDHCPDIPGVAANNGCPSLESLDFHASAIQFVTNSAELVPSSFAELDKLGSFMDKYKSIKLIVEGHTDNVGSTTNNRKLSERRAASVKKYLLSRGIDEKRIVAKGFGLTRPVADNATAEGRQKNRRVEFKVLE